MNESTPVTDEIILIAPETPERRAEEVAGPDAELITDNNPLPEHLTAADLEIIPFDGYHGESVMATEISVVTGDERPEPTRLDNILTIGLVALLALVVIAVVLRKASAKKAPQPAYQPEEPVAPVVEAPTAPGAAGELKLHNVDPKTAAMLMAIVADKLQKPLNELRFISIKEVE